MFKEEKLYLKPIPKRDYVAFKEKETFINKDLTFMYDTCRYSVPSEYAYKNVTLKFSAYEIFCWYKGKLIATHTKSLHKYQNIYDPMHYLDIFMEKPLSIEHAGPLKGGFLPTELATFREKCKDKDKNSQLVKIMQLGREVKQEILLKAVNEANKMPNPSFKSVENFVKYLLHDYYSINNIQDTYNESYENNFNFEDYSFIPDSFIPDNTIPDTIPDKTFDNIADNNEDGNTDED
jgi:hypothetical protein